jgi:lantibiotic modifying enzyme
VLGDRTAREQLPRLVAETVDAGGLLGWPAALPLPIPSPSFMIGMAGMGYQLLRLAAPDEMPSLLLLDPVTVPGEGRS